MDGRRVGRYGDCLLSNSRPVIRVQNIVVSSNCQTAGVALALKAMLPGAQVTGIATPSQSNTEGVERLLLALKGADVWVTSANTSKFLETPSTISTIRIPMILFRSFHPDLTYAFDERSKKNVKGPGNTDYHSKLALWCARNKKSRDFAVSVFTDAVYSKLGFYAFWEREMGAMKASFAASDINFDTFIKPLLRPEPFMHSVNHPTSDALAQIAKQVAGKLGAPQALLDAPIARSIQDTLATGDIWPVYPEIAARFGLSGSYVWKIGNSRFYHSVEDYVNLAYDHYEAFDLDAVNSHGINANLFASVLGEM